DSDEHARDLHARTHAFHNHDSALRHLVAARAVTLGVKADRFARRNADVLIENPAAHLRVTADIDIVQKNAVFHIRTWVDLDPPAQHRTHQPATGKDAATRNYGIKRLTAPP